MIAHLVVDMDREALRRGEVFKDASLQKLHYLVLGFAVLPPQSGRLSCVYTPSRAKFLAT